MTHTPNSAEPVAYFWKYVGKDTYPIHLHVNSHGYIARSINEMDPKNPPYPDTWVPVEPLYATPPAAAPAPAVPEAYQKAFEVLLDFAQTVGGSSSFWDDVWPEHEAAMLAATPAAPAQEPVTPTDEVFAALELDPDAFRTEGGAVNIGKLKAALLHPEDYLPAEHWLRSSCPTKVLMEHSGCGQGTQVDALTVRLNPGDKVILQMGKYTAALLEKGVRA